MTVATMHYNTLAVAGGYRIDTIKGRKHYVFTENGRSVVGPVAQRRKGRGILSRSRLMRAEDLGDMMAQEAQGHFAHLAASTPPPSRRPSRWQRLKNSLRRKDIHQTFQHLMLDVVMGALAVMSLGGVALVVRAVVWAWS